MIVLDTNVISEVMRHDRADRRVLEWLRHLPDRPVTTVINRAEILSGIALLPRGRRRDRLRADAEAAFDQLGACLPFGFECAAHYGDIVAGRQSMGRRIGAMNALVASIARESGATVATRDVADFEGVGLDLIDPWEE